MNKWRRFLYLFIAILFSSSLHADEVDDKDIQALREWINTKRQVTVKELGGALSISGEVRTEFQTTREKLNGQAQRGSGSPCGVPKQAFDVEVNLMLDYRMDRSWASIKIEFDNDAGIFNGTLNRIKLERAYYGIRIVDQDTYTMDFELGRRRLGTIFDSKIEFDSFFDGILYKYDQGFELGDVYLHLGTFVVDERRDHYGYVGEIGILNVANSGFYAKYSLIDWIKHSHNVRREERFDFLISQVILGYKFVPKNWLKAATFYVSGLYNHAAHKLAITDNKRANAAGYVGFVLGELRKQWDWALDVNYQLVQAQAIPEFDVGGIGLGNACRNGFYTVKTDGSGGPTTRKTAAGNGNYRGISLTFDYLLLNNLDLQQSWNQSVTLDKSIGPFRRYHQYEIELIYAF